MTLELAEIARKRGGSAKRANGVDGCESEAFESGRKTQRRLADDATKRADENCDGCEKWTQLVIKIRLKSDYVSICEVVLVNAIVRRNSKSKKAEIKNLKVFLRTTLLSYTITLKPFKNVDLED